MEARILRWRFGLDDQDELTLKQIGDKYQLSRERIRQLLTFLYSTPSYWPSLELFGWKDRGERLHELTRRGAWDEMAGIVDDAMLDDLQARIDEYVGSIDDR